MKQITLTFLYICLIIIFPSKNTYGQQQFPCSLHGDLTVTITLDNQTNQRVDVYWIDYDCQEQLMLTLNPNEQILVTTYNTHPWVIRNAIDSSVIQVFVAGIQSETVIIESSEITPPTHTPIPATATPTEPTTATQESNQGSLEPLTSVYADPAYFSESVEIKVEQIFSNNFGNSAALWNTVFSNDGRYMGYLLEPIGGPPILDVVNLQNGEEITVRFEDYTYSVNEFEDYFINSYRSPKISFVPERDLVLVGFLCADCDTLVFVVDIPSAEILYEFNTDSTIHGFSFSPDGNYMQIGDSTWDIRSGFPGERLPSDFQYNFTSRLADGRYMAIIANDYRSLYAVDIETGTAEQVYQFDKSVAMLQTIANGSQLLVRSCTAPSVGCHFIFLETIDWTIVGEFYLGDTADAAVSPDGSLIAVKYRERAFMGYTDGFYILRTSDGELLFSDEAESAGDSLGFITFDTTGQFLSMQYSSLSCEPLCEQIWQLWQIEQK